MPKELLHSTPTEARNHMGYSAAWNSRGQENTEGGEDKSLSPGGPVGEAGLQSTHNAADVEGTEGTRSDPVFTVPAS